MVYCGKPSRGCYACRQRKTKCDTIPTGCTQCKNAKRQCPGYRSIGDLFFRDESSNVARKSKAIEAKKKAGGRATRQGLVWGGENGALELVGQNEHQLAHFQLAPTIEELATSFFITNYIIADTGPNRGYLDHVEIMAKVGELDESLLSSMKAVGLAGYAHTMHTPQLLTNARYQYLRALRLTNAALRDPVEVKKDGTLLSIIILGIFETITGCRQNALKDWSEHINGASAVIKLRGPDQIKTPQGRRMLATVAASLTIPCLHIGVALPKHVVEYMAAAINYVKTPDPAFIVQDVLIRYTTLHAEILNGSLTDPEIILPRALELDQILRNISENPPEGWEYENVFTDEVSDFVFAGRYHIYFDYWISQIWNSLRSVRILLHEKIRDVLLAEFSTKPPLGRPAAHVAQLQASTGIMYKMQADVLCTIPQHIGYFPTGKTSIKTMSESHEGRIRSFKMSGGAFLIWGLWLVGILDISTEDIRVFVIKNLNYIGTTMGIRQAHILAGILEAKMNITVWEQN